MNRKSFLLTTGGFILGSKTSDKTPEIIYFKDDGTIPNSRYPLLLYRNAFSERNSQGAEWLVGAYPNGMPVDIMRGEQGERPGVDNNILAVPFPGTDPLHGKDEGLRKIWKK